ncbi:MAG: hypothetical protein JNK49_06705 [Planctomycetes bacterium]|nr:hypothetical protein [Planctomycetota bacterium]
MTRRFPFAITLCTLSAAALLLAATARPAPVPGPGAVVAALQAVFTDLDAGRPVAARFEVEGSNRDAALVVDGKYTAADATDLPLLLDVDAAGQPITAANPAQFGQLLAAGLATDPAAKRTLRTRVVRVLASCSSTEASRAIVEFERTLTIDGREQRVPMRATALVHYDAKFEPPFKIHHWHASRAAAPAPVGK